MACHVAHCSLRSSEHIYPAVHLQSGLCHLRRNSVDTDGFYLLISQGVEGIHEVDIGRAVEMLVLEF